ncbi:MAG: hypothetical protein AAGF07_00575 [Patescibacteria group bacterium]
MENKSYKIKLEAKKYINKIPEALIYTAILYCIMQLHFSSLDKTVKNNLPESKRITIIEDLPLIPKDIRPSPEQ